MSQSLVTSAIEFRSLISQLTVIEITHFIDKLSSNIIINALFHFIISKKDKNLSEILNNTISKIIQSRNIKQIQSQTKSSIIVSKNKLSDLPKSVIGVTASFLDRHSYQNFQKICRYVFLGCNSPNLLQELSFYAEDQMIYLHLFPLIKHLSLNLNQILLTTTTLKNLESLTIYRPSYKVDLHLEQRLFNIIDKIDTTNITHLYLTGWQYNASKYDGDKLFTRFINKFNSLEYLSIALTYWSDSHRISFPRMINLRGLDIDEVPYCLENMLFNIGHQLEYLKISNFYEDYKNEFKIDFANIKFTKLKQFCFNTDQIDINVIQSIIKTAINLEKIQIITSIKSFGEILATLLIKHRLLTYIEFKRGNMIIDTEYKSFCKNILDGFISALSKVKHFKTTKLKIKICDFWKLPHTQQTDPEKQFLNNIIKMFNILKTTNIVDFMLIFNYTPNGLINSQNEKEYVMQYLNDRLSRHKIIKYYKGISKHYQGCNEHYEGMFVVANYNCRINGYEETWIMRQDISDLSIRD